MKKYRFMTEREKKMKKYVFLTQYLIWKIRVKYVFGPINIQTFCFSPSKIFLRLLESL